MRNTCTRPELIWSLFLGWNRFLPGTVKANEERQCSSRKTTQGGGHWSTEERKGSRKPGWGTPWNGDVGSNCGICLSGRGCSNGNHFFWISAKNLKASAQLSALCYFRFQKGREKIQNYPLAQFTSSTSFSGCAWKLLQTHKLAKQTHTNVCEYSPERIPLEKGMCSTPRIPNTNCQLKTSEKLCGSKCLKIRAGKRKHQDLPESLLPSKKDSEIPENKQRTHIE